MTEFIEVPPEEPGERNRERTRPPEGLNPEERPDDRCVKCGRRRDRLLDENPLHAEIVHGDGSVDWLCRACDGSGRELK